MTGGGSARSGAVTWAGLAVVAGAAAVLSFATVRDLALSSGYPPGLAWLLPVVIDATAVVGSRIWLGGGANPGAVRYASTLALAAAVTTIAANVLQHGLVAHHATPPWWLVAVLAAIPPTALVAVAHQVALLARPSANEGSFEAPDHPAVEDRAVVDELTDDPEVSAAEMAALQAEADAYDANLLARGRRFLAESGGSIGRRRLAEGLGVSDWTARRLLAEITESDVQPDTDATYARS
ncbi:MAG: hypothetical protein JWO67_6308 [Streptosporangiaceae bacterium]|nr:hypothetical protein [Streptosporangiaceae bacterium]